METLFKKSKTALSLTTTLTIAFLIFGVLVLSISSGLQLFFNIQAQRAIISSDQQLVAQEAARSVSGFIQEKWSILETAIWLTEPAAASPAEQKLMLDSLLGLQPAFQELVLLNAQDQALAQAARLSQKSPWRLTDQLNGDMLAGLHQRRKYVGPVYFDPATSEPRVIMAVPVSDVLGDFKGSLVAEVNLRFIWDLVGQLKVGEAGRAYVVDRQGNLIAFGDTARVLKGENVGHLQVVSEFILSPASAPAAGVSTYPGITGTTVVGTYVPLEMPDWAVVTELPWQEAYRDVIRQAWVSIGITLAMAALAGVMGIYLARRLAVPVVHLKETATRIAGGERELQAVIEGPEETASLAMVFNSMTAQLRQSMEGLEQRVIERTAQLEAANKELEAFSYSVSHDLRAPLRAIDGYSRILVEDYGASLDVEAQQVCAVIQNETRRMGQLIDDLLAFSRLSRAAMQPAPIDMTALVQAVFKEIPPTESRDRLEFQIESLPPAQGDPTLIRQVWVNLLSNACKFSAKREQPVIIVGGRQDEGENLYYVRDNGAGFDMCYANKLFGVFQRLHSEHEFEGTGVGLAIVQRVVHRHGGRVWAESKIDQGATFYFTLPRKED